MSDIFKEVDEEVQRDKVALFFKKHANVLIGLALLVVIGVGGYRVWSYFEMRKAAEAGKAYEAALSLAAEGKDADARTAMEALGKDAPAGYKTLVAFKLASDLAKTDKPAAAAAFDALAGDSALDPVLRDLARLRAGQILVDTAPLAEVRQRLEPLAAPGQAWRLAAREALAAAALKTGDGPAAEKYIDQILADAETTRTYRERAEVLMALVRAGNPAPAPVRITPVPVPPMMMSPGLPPGLSLPAPAPAAPAQ